MLDQLIGEIRDERVDDTRVEESGRRVWDRIQRKSVGSGRLASCDDFQALIPSYREDTLAPGRRMLLEDHAHQCVVCRKVLFGETEAPPKVIDMPARRMTRARWMAIAASVTVALIAGRWGYEQFAPAPGGSRATVQIADGGVFRLENGMLQPVSAGVELRDGQILRTSAGSHAVVKLADRSLVEVGERAEFKVSAARRRHDGAPQSRRSYHSGRQTPEWSFVRRDRRFASGRYGDRLFCQSWSQGNTSLRD